MKEKLSIYLARPISGRSYEEVVSWCNSIKSKLTQMGYIVFHPMIGKDILRTEKKFRSEGYVNIPAATNHAIVERDKWMVTGVDVALFDLSDTNDVSIGCMFEMAWASDNNTHTVAVIPEKNIHRHAFVLEAAGVVFETLDESLSYLKSLAKR